ncbi:pyrH, partial [Mucuna pruriens]
MGIMTNKKKKKKQKKKTEGNHTRKKQLTLNRTFDDGNRYSLRHNVVSDSSLLMATEDYPLLDSPSHAQPHLHAPTRHHFPSSSSSSPTTLPASDSVTADYYPHTSFSDDSAGPAKSVQTPNSKRASAAGSPYHYNKKLKPAADPDPAFRGGEDYRKDREEWSDRAIACLLETYTEKFKELNRGNLRGRDWEEVAEAVGEQCGGEGKHEKSVEQCKNKIDNLKKRYKVELQRIGSGGIATSHWHWFNNIEAIIANSFTVKTLPQHHNPATAAAANSSSMPRQTNNRSYSSNLVILNFCISLTPTTETRFDYCCKLGIVQSFVHDGVTGHAFFVVLACHGVRNKYWNGPLTASDKSLRRYANNLKTKPVSNLKWRRVLFKISGSALSGNCQNIDPKVPVLFLVAMQIAREVATACRLGVEVAIVVGGRNFFCGDAWVSATGLDRPTAFQIGMMATVMNSILLQSALEKLGVEARVQSAFSMPEVAEPYSRQRAIRHLEKGRVVIFGGVGVGVGVGTVNPLFTTDTTAALRASELNADAVLKGTNVNGVFDCHPRNDNLTIDHISFREIVSRGVTSMDMMALAYCEENGIPVVVFNMLEPGNVSRALCGDQVGTLIDQTGRVEHQLPS